MTPSTTRFAGQHGFELGLAHSTSILRSEALAKLRNSIAAKDRAENDALLITFGGFDHTGFRWPAESLVFGLLTAEDLPPVEARHLRRVYLHDWSGSVAEVPLSPVTL